VTAATVKTAKLEADKKKSKRKTIPTLTSKEIKEEDEATNDLPLVDNRAALRSPCPATRRQREMERQVTEEDLYHIREGQVVAASAQAKMPVKIRVRPLRPKLRAPVVVR
jgi:hypothetical protein